MVIENLLLNFSITTYYPLKKLNVQFAQTWEKDQDRE